jgi:hypothetical protein
VDALGIGIDVDLTVIVNEEGKLIGLPLNRALRDENGEVYDIIAGSFLVAGLTEDNFGSLTEEQIGKFDAWEKTGVIPNSQLIPDFAEYFATYHKHLRLRPQQTLHFELGRSVVGQCGNLITKVIYVKQGTNKQFAIVDGGMTDLIRPALYQAYHKIENLTSEEPAEAYDVVGPICESSDVFGKAIDLNKVHRGDLIALRSAGAYGEIMASGYNCRPLPQGYTSDELV